ncbi:MAG: hypothetical protein ACI9PP_002243 [Halobacteriales archaeon]|jgi:hypothetical protein
MSFGSTSRPVFAPGNGTLAALDAVILIVVLIVGELQHGFDPLNDPIRVSETLAPFLVGWVVFASVAGLYARTDRPLVPDLRLLVVTWFAAANVGLVLRTSPWLHGGVLWPFGVVVTGMVLVALVAWRIAFAVLTPE